MSSRRAFHEIRPHYVHMIKKKQTTATTEYYLNVENLN